MSVGVCAQWRGCVGMELFFRVGEESLRRKVLGDAWTDDAKRATDNAPRRAALKTLMVVLLVFQIVSRV